MSTRDKIIEAQGIILDNLAACEEAISKLYALYARVIPDMKNFWTDLSDKETIHATLLRSMHRQLEGGHIFQNIGRFDLKKTESFLCSIRDATARAEAEPPSREDAVATALGIEASVLDSHFYEIVESDAPEFRTLADRLLADTREHVTLVQDELITLRRAQANPNVDT